MSTLSSLVIPNDSASPCYSSVQAYEEWVPPVCCSAELPVGYLGFSPTALTEAQDSLPGRKRMLAYTDPYAAAFCLGILLLFLAWLLFLLSNRLTCCSCSTGSLHTAALHAAGSLQYEACKTRVPESSFYTMLIPKHTTQPFNKLY